MRVVIVLAKAPLPGFAKTRLARGGAMSEDDAARLADSLLRDTVRACTALERVELVLCITPGDAATYFRSLAPDALVTVQADGDLGRRMSAAFDAAFARGASRVVVIGTDTPQLRPASIERAFRELDASACVLGPADDGGYYLIALRKRRPELFDGVEWSTERVLAQTLERARACGLEVALLEPLSDVDDVAALERLERSLASDGEPCPHTARWLAERRAGPPLGARDALSPRRA